MAQQIDLNTIMDEAGGFSPECYPFIRDGLAHTVEMIHGLDGPGPGQGLDDESRHVSGKELCLGLRDYGVEQYGLLAKTVLNRWGIRETKDFGKIVFAMVDAGLMRKTDDDTIRDFTHVYDFDEAFDEPAPSVSN